MTTEIPPDANITKLGDETRQTSLMAFKLCGAIETLHALWGQAIVAAESQTVPPANLFEMDDNVVAGQLRSTVDEFYRVLCEVDRRLTRDLQEAHIQRLYPAPISFCGKTYTSYADAVRTIGLKLFEEAMLSLIRELNDGIYVLFPEIFELPGCVDMYAHHMAVQWRRIGSVLGANETDTTSLAKLLTKERLQVETLVYDSQTKTRPIGVEQLETAKPVMTRQEKKLKWLTQAMMLLQNDPGRPDCEIAKKVGVHPSTLSRDDTYRAAAERARAASQSNAIKKGRLIRDRDTKTTDVEAYDFDHEDRDFDS